MRLSSDTNILALSHRYEYLSLIQIIVADILSHLAFHSNLLTLSLCIWQASSANKRNSHTVSKYVNLRCNISCKS